MMLGDALQSLDGMVRDAAARIAPQAVPDLVARLDSYTAPAPAGRAGAASRR